MTATDPIRVAIVGVGKIARDQHLPSIAGNPAFELAATVSRSGGIDGVPNFATVEELLAARPDIGALSLCQPPQVRYAAAAKALAARRHLMLEKPPGATVSEVQALQALAARNGVTLFATWHSRFAAAVEPARQWLADRVLRRVTVTWKEDVRRWHPGQAWIWQPGGLGVFDPGINALSIVTAILPQPVHLVDAVLEFPAGREAPIAAHLDFAGAGGLVAPAALAWRQTGPQTWDIEIETDAGVLTLAMGGARMAIDGRPVGGGGAPAECGRFSPGAPRRGRGARPRPRAPLVQVADAFMLGRRKVVEAFED